MLGILSYQTSIKRFLEKNAVCFATLMRFLGKIVARETQSDCTRLRFNNRAEDFRFSFSSPSYLSKKDPSCRSTEETSYVFKRDIRRANARYRRLSARVQGPTDWTWRERAAAASRLKSTLFAEINLEHIVDRSHRRWWAVCHRWTWFHRSRRQIPHLSSHAIYW